MYKYAEIYCGKVRDIQESPLGYTDFCSIFDPTSFWVDVTGIEDIEVGYLIKSNTTVGTYFESPDAGVDISSFEYKQAEKLRLLSHEFDTIQKTAYVTSSLGFVADAGERANRDVDGLIKRMTFEGLASTKFRDHNNIFQFITFEEAKTLELEIIQNGYYIYSQKWDLERRIMEATTVEELDSITVEFKMLDLFSTPYTE